MKKFQLGEFEEVVMLTVAILYDDAYGMAIKRDIETRLDRKVSIGALQSALKRLVDKGYLEYNDDAPSPERAGRPKRFYNLTAFGKQAIRHARETRNALWGAIPSTLLNTI